MTIVGGMELKKSDGQNTFLAWGACVLVLLMVVLFSSVSKPFFVTHYLAAIDALPLSKSVQRYLLTHYKLGHPTCYAILTMVLITCLRGRYLLTIALAFSLGAALELVQSFLPTRAASLADLVLNLKGILVGALLVFVFNWVRSRLQTGELDTQK